MKQDDMEKRFQTAVEHAAPDVLDQVMDGCTQLPDTAAIIPLPRRRRRLPLAILSTAAAVLLAIVIVILIALLFFVENIFGKDVEG